MSRAKVALGIVLVGLFVGMLTAARYVMGRHGYGDIWDQRAFAREDARRAAERERTLAALPEVPGRVYLAQGCAATADRFSPRTGLSGDEAARVFREEYAGRWVRWAAAATRSNAMGDGQTMVQFRCSERSFLMDGHVIFDAGSAAAAGALSRREVFAFEAQLTGENPALGLLLSHATLIGAAQ